MIELFYTNAKSFNTDQSEPTRSLGGWISRTLVPHASPDGIFQGIGLFSLSSRNPTSIALAVKGDIDTIYIGVSPSNLFTFCVGRDLVLKQEFPIEKKTDYYSKSSILNNAFYPQLDFIALSGVVAVPLAPLDGWSVIWLTRTWSADVPALDDLETEEVLFRFDSKEFGVDEISGGVNKLSVLPALPLPESPTETDG